METLTERQREILSVVVNAYVETACPVGSKMVTARYSDDLSSATIRNEMALLEAQGYITHPHTSAGRIPTDKGYRFYVDTLLKEKPIEPSEAGLIAREYRQKVKGIEELIERTSKILSFLTEQAGLVLYPSPRELVLKRLELISYGHAHLLVIWATTTGIVQSKMVDMEEEIESEDLARLSRFLNAELTGKNFGEILLHLGTCFANAKDFLARQYSKAQRIVSQTFEIEDERKLSLDGSRFVLKQPEFREDAAKAKTFFRALETKEALQEVLRENLAPGEIRVRIGSENSQKEIWDCTLVTTQYYFQNRSLGTLGVFGLKRMPYGRIIPLVDYIARRFSEALESLV